MSHVTYCSMGMSSSAGGSPKEGSRRSRVRMRCLPMTPSTLSLLRWRSRLASSKPPLSTVMVMGSREITALEPSGVRSSTSISMARSPRPTLSASSLTMAAISAGSYNTRENCSGETFTLFFPTAVLMSSAALSVGLGRRLGLAQGGGAGDAARLDHEGLELACPCGRPVDVSRSADQRLEHHLPVPPVVHLVDEDELEPADGGRVGDRARGVEVERVRRDLVRDQDAV